jgi:hypothetical protein
MARGDGVAGWKRELHFVAQSFFERPLVCPVQVYEHDMNTVLDPQIGRPQSPQQSTESHTVAAYDSGYRPGFFALLCGVLWPGIALLVEIITGMAADIWIDPIPSWAHAAIIAVVPVMNGWLIARMRAGRAIGRGHLLGLALALGVTMVYWVEFLPFTLFGPLLCWTGIGLLPMAPMISCVATGRLWVRASSGMRWSSRLKLASLGIAAGIAMLAIVEIPTFMAAVGLTLAVNGKGDQRERGTTILKYLAGNPELARFGAAESATRFNLAIELANNWLGLPMPGREDVAREIYRATGKPLDQIHKTRRGLDDLRASDQVGALLPKLALNDSKIEIVAEPDGGYSYTQWTMEFFNAYDSQQEARAEVVLPSGGVVSRLTLWVNGEEREAAFAGKSEVRAAYTAIVAKQRDPVLVTMTAPGRVLMQCFPVPPRGTMKIRLGITAPLLPESEKSARFVYPQFTHQNFRIDGKHKIVFHVADVGDVAGFNSVTDENGRRFEGELKFEEGVSSSVLFPTQHTTAKHWVRDARSEKFVVQSIRAEKTAVRKPIVVIDGSSSLQPVVGEIRAALSQLSGARVILATPRAPKELPIQALNADDFSGGADNTLALQDAARLAREAGGDAIVWVHGPQPVLLTAIEDLNRELKRSSDLALWSLQLVPGRNALLEQLNLTARVETPAITTGSLAMLASSVRKIAGAEPIWGATYEVTDRRPGDVTAKEGSSHLARLWAAGRVRELAARGDAQEAVQLAQKYQLVTPVSGAVVLETIQQFRDAGLKAVDKDSVPAVPEPTTWALIILGVIVVGAARRRTARA